MTIRVTPTSTTSRGAARALLLGALAVAAAGGSALAGMAAADPPAPAAGAANGGASASGAGAAAVGTGAPVVLELFTSQGCSTCPPADRLLSELGAGGAAGQVVPLAFHVDYWDHQGWTDPYDAPEWSKRQQAYAHALSGDRVATPQLVIDGRSECVGSRRDEVLQKIAAARAQQSAAAVELAADTPTRSGSHSRLRVKVSVRVLQQTSSRDLDLWVALTQSGLVTTVKGGENASAVLHDDYVVRRLDKAFTIRGRAGEQRAKEITIDLDPSWKDLAVAAFVQDPSSLVIVGAARTPVAAQP